MYRKLIYLPGSKIYQYEKTEDGHEYIEYTLNSPLNISTIYQEHSFEELLSKNTISFIYGN
jgi:hypothetical protein